MAPNFLRNEIRKFRQNPLLLYCLLSYILTWSIAFGIYYLFRTGQLSEHQLNLYHSWAAVGPAIGAVVSTYFFYGKNGLVKLLGKFHLVFPRPRTLLLVFSPLLFFGFGLLVYRLLQGAWYSFDAFAEDHWRSRSAFWVWLLPLLTYAIFEEIGWRGFLLPHLQEKYNAWTATIYLSVIWAFWHIPFFFYRFDFSIFISVGFFFGIFVGAVLLTAIYNSSGGMLIPVMLFHFLNNLCSMFDKELIAAVLSTGFVFLAIYVYRKYGKQALSEKERIGNYFTRSV